MLNAPFSGHAICKMIQKRCKRFGLEGVYGGHSGRRGFVDTSLIAGKSINKVMAQTGHANLKTLQEYFDEHKRWKNNASEGIY